MSNKKVTLAKHDPSAPPSPLNLALMSLADKGWSSDEAREFLLGMPWRHRRELHGVALRAADLVQELLRERGIEDREFVERLTREGLWQLLAERCGFAGR